jgi:serine/threonine protein kinase
VFAELVEELTAKLQDGTPFDVEAYLADHPEHAERLRALLPALRMLAAVSESGPDGSALPPAGESAGEPPGTLGDFRILREVGRGGMGIVYEAEQISLGRRVALKVLPFAATMDPRQLQRFHNEARAAASLHHEHIVPVYYVGCERAVHFYAMQFIEGQSLAQLIAAQGPGSRGLGLPEPGDATALYRASPAKDSPASPAPDARTVAAASTQAAPRDAACFRRFAEWGIQAAEALEHAHSLGIVHRDVKPANLMVDGRVKLWVADFGLARTVNDAGLTMSGDLLGTLRYMSPEQALARHGLVDHRTDVYSLGATLYELLTGRPAVEGKDRQEILKRIADGEPPRAADSGVPADLETIVLKALAKEPAERYATAQELADDLRRFLEHRPIRARRPTWLQRLRKGARRHQAVVTAAATTLAVALALSTVVIWRERDGTLTALHDAKIQRDEAHRKGEFARRVVNDMYTQVAMDWLAHEPQLSQVQLQFLRKALEFYKELASEGGSDAGQWLKTGQAYCRVGDIAGLFPGEEDGEAAYRQALAIFQRLAGEFPQEKKYRQELADTERKLGAFLDFNDRFPEAEEFLSRALSRSVQLASELPDDADVRASRAACLENLGNLWRRIGRSREADNVLRQAVEAWKNLADQFPDVLYYQESLGDAYKHRYLLLLEADCLEEAGQACRQAIDVHEKLSEDPSARWIHLALSGSYSTLAYILAERDDLTEAEKVSDQALRLRQQVAAEFPADPRVQHTLALSYSYHGHLLTLLGRPRDAESEYQQAVKLARTQVQLNPAIPGRRQELAMMLGYLAWLHAYGPAPVRDAGKALTEAREALDLAPGHGPYLTTLLGAVHYRFGDGKRTASLLQSAQGMSQGATQPAQAWFITSSILKRDAQARERLAPALCLFFQAMNHWDRQEKELARECYRQGLGQLAGLRITTRLPREELEAIRAEAAALLELAP